MRRHLAVAIVVLAAVGLAALGTGGALGGQRPSGRAAVAAPIAFSVPAPVDPVHTFGEPTIGVNPATGEVFASGPTGTGTQRSLWEGSIDGGQSFRPITPGAPPTAAQGTQAPPGGGDTDINFDRAGKTYFSDLYALACLRDATTSDGGATVNENLDGCGTSPPADRQWLAVYDPPPGTPHQSAYTGTTPLVYLEYNNLNGPGPNAGAQWNKSTDGLTFSNATSGVTAATQPIYSPFGPDGYPAIDQRTGKVLQAASAPDADGKTFDLLLNIGTPDAQGNLTFLDAPASPGSGQNTPGLIHVADKLPGTPDTLFTVASMDSARNLYVAWAVSGTPEQRQVYVAAASAASGWRKWTTPVRVSDASVSRGDAVNLFPWIKAGGAGRVDVVWYGSDKNVDPSSQNGQAWNVFMSQPVFPVDGTGAVTGPASATPPIRATPHPMHLGDICLQGSACATSQGNRNLADFFSVTIDRSGAAEILYDDTSNGLSQGGFTPSGNQSVDHAGAPIPTLIRQSSGMGLYGRPVAGSSSEPVGGIADPPGDARYPVLGGRNVPGLDVLGSSLHLATDRRTLTVTTKLLDLTDPAATIARVPGTQELQYVTRWQMGNTLFYAAMSMAGSGGPTFSAGRAQSVDLCSVSACDPHVITYPEAGNGGMAQTGRLFCPPRPSAANPCTITITVNAADVGAPTASSVLEETGSYAFAAAHSQGSTTNAQALADNVPLEVDGACCFNYRLGATGTAHPGPIVRPPGKPKGRHRTTRPRRHRAPRHRATARHRPARHRSTGHHRRTHPRDPDHDGDIDRNGSV